MAFLHVDLPEPREPLPDFPRGSAESLDRRSADLEYPVHCNAEL